MKRSVLRFSSRFAKEEILLISVLGVLFITFIVLVVVLIGSERNRNTLLAEYEADRAASALLETYRESIVNVGGQGQSREAITAQSLPSDVQGFGVYSLGGAPLRTIGEAPRSIAGLIPQVRPSLFQFDQRAGTIALLRMVGAMPGGPPGGPGEQMGFRDRDRRDHLFGMMGQGVPPQPFPPDRRAFPARGSVPGYVYVKLSTHAFFANRSLLTLAIILVPIALGIAMLVVWLLYLKNRRYREKIESQKHLVHLGEIARTLSHEIKNPLSSIRLQTGIMRRIFSEKAPRELTLIEEETDRLTQLVERIGEFLRDPIGSPEAIEIAGFLQDLISRFDWNIERTELPDEAVYINFDRNRLRTVLENILKNAAESGGEATPFSIVLQASKQRVEIRVVDRGTGIPEELREKIFDPFYTTKVKGSGIGLAISKRFVESLEGTLQLQNTKRGGTEARITLKREFHEHDARGGE
jgi:two-component system sensor histidine kinase HydH